MAFQRQPLLQEYSIYCNYLAPKGRRRLSYLGSRLAERHLVKADMLIGVVGGSGSGKSSLIKGMFPDLELSNDDDTIHPHRIMQVKSLIEELQESEDKILHIDMRFQLAFTQMHEIVTFVRNVLKNGKRIIIEHFDLLYPALQINADMLIGIGDEILIVRPNVFGPLPKNIYDIVYSSLQRRKAAHTLEHVAIEAIEKNFGGKYEEDFFSSEISGGFVLRFDKKPENLDLHKLEELMHELVDKKLPVCYVDEDHIKIGKETVDCNGSRIHVTNTSEIGPFILAKELIYDIKNDTYCLLGLLGETEEDIHNLNKLRSLG